MGIVLRRQVSRCIGVEEYCGRCWKFIVPGPKDKGQRHAWENGDDRAYSTERTGGSSQYRCSPGEFVRAIPKILDEWKNGTFSKGILINIPPGKMAESDPFPCQRTPVGSDQVMQNKDGQIKGSRVSPFFRNFACRIRNPVETIQESEPEVVIPIRCKAACSDFFRIKPSQGFYRPGAGDIEVKKIALGFLGFDRGSLPCFD